MQSRLGAHFLKMLYMSHFVRYAVWSEVNLFLNEKKFIPTFGLRSISKELEIQQLQKLLRISYKSTNRKKA